MGRIFHRRDDKGYCKRGMGILFIFVLATMGEASKGCWNQGGTELRIHGSICNRNRL